MQGKKTDFLNKWSQSLDAEQMRPILILLMEIAVDAEMLGVGDISPYWTNTGDPLVDGQKVWKDD